MLWIVLLCCAIFAWLLRAASVSLDRTISEIED